LALQLLLPLVELTGEEHRLEEAKQVLLRNVRLELFVDVSLLIEDGEVGDLGLEDRLNRQAGTPLGSRMGATPDEGVRGARSA
jgi:hypothetical protein